jgi:hypothetical protein
MRPSRLTEVEQRLYSRRVADIPQAVRRAWEAAGCGRRIQRGFRVAITVGSRPFVLPSMGSHGGATPAGQTEILRSLGVTAESVGAPVRASMAAVSVGKTSNGLDVYTSREALDADGVIVMNRVKQHTDFAADYESGIVKMLTIGMGKREGATAMHSRRVASLREDVPEGARMLLERLPILGAIAILENGHHETADVLGIPPRAILHREKSLLRRVRRNAARLPFKDIDLLIVDWIGKDISGVGFDTHVIGRRMIWGEPEFRGGRFGAVAALDLTPGSKGNPLGVGLADLVTERLVRKIDWDALRTNVLHTGFLNRAKLPIAFPNDKRLIQAAHIALGQPDPDRVRIVRIADTLRLDRMWISEGLLAEAQDHPRLTIVGSPAEMRFDRAGNLKRLARSN